MIIKYGDADITGLILEYSRKGNVDDENILLLGNTPSYQIDLKIDNEGGILQTLSGNICEYSDDGILKGTYAIYEAPEKYTALVRITCFDSMFLSNIPYDSKLKYPTTIKDQLDEISKMTGLTIDYNGISTNILEHEVNWWDNTIACRDYIGWIAEISGMNAFSDPAGRIVFKELSMDSNWQTEDIDDYETDETFIISRVCFDNGLLKLVKGNEEGNTLYLSANNPYIDSLHDPTDVLLKKYQGFHVVSISKVRAGGLDDLGLFDVVEYQNIKFICLELTSTYKGGEYQIQDISGMLPSKNADKAIIRYDTKTRIKKIEVIMDQNEQTLEIMAKKQEDQDKQITSITLEQGEIKQTLEKNEENVKTLANAVSMALSTNYVAAQSYDQASKKYAPDYTLTPLKINATVTDRLLSKPVEATITWKRKIQGDNKWTDLDNEEVALGMTLTLSHNLAKTTEYKAYARVVTGNTEYTAEASITVSVNILEDTTIKGNVCNIEASSYCFSESKKTVEVDDGAGNITTETVSVYNPGNITLTPRFFNCNFDAWLYSTDLGSNYSIIEPTDEAYVVDDEATTMDTNIVRVKVGEDYLEGVSFHKEKKLLMVNYDADCFTDAHAVVFQLKCDVENGTDTVTLTIDGDYSSQLGSITGALDALTESYTSVIQDLNGLEGTITSRIEQTDATYTEMYEDVQKQITEIIQTASEIIETFTTVKEWVSDNGTNLEEISTYIRRSAAGIEVGEVNAAVKTLMGTSYFAILLNDKIAMKLEQDLLTIEQIFAQSGFQLGNNVFTANSAGFRITWGGS